MFNYKKTSFMVLMLLTLGFVSCGYTLKTLKTHSTNTLVEDNKDALNSAIQVQSVLRKISQSMKPTVVNIQVVTKPVASSLMGDKVMDELLRRFFGDRGFGGQDDREQNGPSGSAVGSGFVVSEDGYIVTNAHVVNNAKTITVVLEDQSSYEADLIGADIKTDIALLKIKTKVQLNAAPLGDSDIIEPGDFAVAIGNPFGLTGTLTFGIISAKGRNSFIEENAAYKNYIQTDVPINPGNSGGPLINIQGQVVGLNSAIYSTSGGSIGIGFAIPINIVKNVINQLLQTGHVTRGTIGVLITPISKDIAKAYGMKNTKGVLINEIVEGSAAEKAGLQIWDAVTAINGKPVQDAGDFLSKISSYTPNQSVALDVIRDGKPLKINITISGKDYQKDTQEKTSSNKADKTSVTWHKMKLMTVSEAQKILQGVPKTMGEGVIIVEIEENAPILSKGIVPGDTIIAINKQPVKTLADISNFKESKISYVQFKSSRMGRNILVVLP